MAHHSTPSAPSAPTDRDLDRWLAAPGVHTYPVAAAALARERSRVYAARDRQGYVTRQVTSRYDKATETLTITVA